jgi:hypothetical protein
MAIRLQTHHWRLAHRLLLAHFNGDADMLELLNSEVGECPRCWRLVAHYAALLATMTTRPAELEARVDDLFGGLEFAADARDDEILWLGDPDEGAA